MSKYAKYCKEEVRNEWNDSVFYYVYSVGRKTKDSLYYDIQGNIAPILIPVGEVVAEAALEAAAAAAAAALAAVAGTLAGEAISQSCKRCRPCDPPVGTLMYQIHTDHTHAGMNPHIHYFVVNQSPPDMGCRCFTPRRGSNVEAGDKPKAGAIPYRYPSGGGTY